MRHRMLWLALLSAGTVRAQSPVNFTIKGQLGPLSGPAKVYLRREGLFQGAITDSARVKDGAFVLRGTTPTPGRARLVLVLAGKRRRLLTGQADQLRLYLEPGTLTLSSPDSLTHAALVGGPLNTEYQALQRQLTPVQAPLDVLLAEYYATPPAQREATGVLRRLNTQQKLTEPVVKSLQTGFVQEHPRSLISLDVIQDLAGPIPTYEAVGPLFLNLDASVQNTPQGLAFAKQLLALKRVAVGATAPAFSLPTADGRTVALADYRGKYVLVDFWASWCGPCRRDNPNLVRSYRQFRPRNFEVVGISLDTAADRAKWLKAVQDDQLPWTQVWAPEGWNQGVAPLYNVRAIPQNFLLDPAGRIIATNLHGAELQSTLARVLPAAP
ncbi:TlpA disulfide reductase family protein [Hymenobacter gummosus]|nr:TlpA disulfide reductase family protein [Hymenobacter gummosus]